jgi:hypothetical protein
MARMIKIVRFYEEAALADEPRWYVDEEDARRYTREPFGAAGDAWATVYGVELVYSDGRKLDRFWDSLGRAVGLTDRLGGWLPFSGSFQLRVCSPSFVEDDPRFLTTDGRLRGLVREEFSAQAVQDFCRERVAQASPLGMGFVAALERDFFYWDPDADPILDA